LKSIFNLSEEHWEGPEKQNPDEKGKGGKGQSLSLEILLWPYSTSIRSHIPLLTSE
jgi:hypothetical protein